eukprot:COSAG05_NODE_337_length_11164_cov_11.970357_5_plen_34_part_00
MVIFGWLGQNPPFYYYLHELIDPLEGEPKVVLL